MRGANNSTRTVTRVSSSNLPSIFLHLLQVFIYAGGNDTLNCAGYAQNAVINLNAGTFSNIGNAIANVSIALGVTVENAIGGGGNDAITGNPADNILSGNGGNDAIDGGAGSDTVVYSGARWQYQTEYSGSGVVHIVDGRAGTPDGADEVEPNFSSHSYLACTRFC